MTWRWTAASVGAAGLLGYAAGLWRGHSPVEVAKHQEKTATSVVAMEGARSVTSVYPPKVVVRRTIKLPDGTLTVDEREETGAAKQVIQEAVKIAAESRIHEVVRVEAVTVRPRYHFAVIGGFDGASLLGGNRAWMVGGQAQIRVIGPVYLGGIALAVPENKFVGLSAGVSF